MQARNDADELVAALLAQGRTSEFIVRSLVHDHCYTRNAAIAALARGLRVEVVGHVELDEAVH